MLSCISSELSSEILINIPKHSTTLPLFEFKTKFILSWFERDVIVIIQAQARIDQLNTFLEKIEQSSLPESHKTIEIYKKGGELRGELGKAEAYLDVGQHEKVTPPIDKADIIASEMLVLLIENMTRTVEAMTAINAIPSILDVKEPIKFGDIINKINIAKQSLFSTAIARDGDAYNKIRSPEKRGSKGVTFCGHKSEDEVWVCNYCKSTTKKMDKYALSELSWHEYLCVRKPLQMDESQQVVSRGFTPISMHIDSTTGDLIATPHIREKTVDIQSFPLHDATVADTSVASTNAVAGMIEKSSKRSLDENDGSKQKQDDSAQLKKTKKAQKKEDSIFSKNYGLVNF